jgi:hypothetical protein
MIEAMLVFSFVVSVIWLCLRDPLFRRAVAMFFKWGLLLVLVTLCAGYGIYLANKRPPFDPDKYLREHPATSSYGGTR